MDGKAERVVSSTPAATAACCALPATATTLELDRRFGSGSFSEATAAATASAVTLDSLTASPSADERFRNSMHSSTASFLMESSRRHVTAPVAPACGEEVLPLLLRCTEALETAVSMMRRSTTSRMRSSSDTDAAGRAVDARHLPLVSRGMHAALAALAALLFMLYVRS